MTIPQRITILFDNYPGLPGLEALWGFAAVLETPSLIVLFDTGMLDGEPPEQAMVVDSQDAVSAVSGCAHPGMDAIVERAASFLGKKVDWAIGGFHLMYADSARIEQSIRSLQDLGVRFVVPTHCTGDEAVAAFRRSYGSHYIAGGVGRRVVLDKDVAG